MAELAFQRVWKRYGGVEALRGLDLTAADGELLVLVGPSGSGKSSALRMAAGLEEVSEGTITIGGRDVTDTPPVQRNVSMVFQSYALFPHLSVAQNIGFGLRARRVPREETERRIVAAASAVGCQSLLHRKPYQLSGGERQRVALARALVREPDVFLLDEPLSNLDAQLRVDTRAELKRLHQHLGATMVYVTHDQIEALTIGDRVAVLDRGVLQQVGTPDEVYRQPENRFVARFVGSPAMNVLPGIVQGITIFGGPFRIDSAEAAARCGNRRIEVGVRPEHVGVSLDGMGTPSQVQVVESAGNETFLYLEARSHEIVARVDAELKPGLGSTVGTWAYERDVYVFDADTGDRIWPAHS